MTSLQDNITIVQDSLDDIRDAIILKGGTITSDITYYAIDILNISVGLNREISPQGVFQYPTTDFTFSLPSNAANISHYVLYYAFYNCTSLTSLSFPSLTTISGYYALSYAFYNCTSLTSIDLPLLTTISGNYALSNAFRYCASLASLSFPSLTTISGEYALSNAFRGCTSLTSLSFPSLTSFGSYTNQFNNMLLGVTGCTVHFPSNLQSIIGSWSSVISGFGGTNTIVLFDLPATSQYTTNNS